MSHQQVTIARIYIREAEHLLPKLLKFLHDEEKVAGVTVLRGIAGFSGDGKMHLASLIDLSLDLPLVVEFHDQTEKAAEVIAKLKARFHLPHIISWPATWHIDSV
jgi:PII-like signaling protein